MLRKQILHSTEVKGELLCSIVYLTAWCSVIWSRIWLSWACGKLHLLSFEQSSHPRSWMGCLWNLFEFLLHSQRFLGRVAQERARLLVRIGLCLEPLCARLRVIHRWMHTHPPEKFHILNPVILFLLWPASASRASAPDESIE